MLMAFMYAFVFRPISISHTAPVSRSNSSWFSCIGRSSSRYLTPPLLWLRALLTRIESLASKLKFPRIHLYQNNGSERRSHRNAYAFGLPRMRAFLPLSVPATNTVCKAKLIVIFDTIIQQNQTDDVEGVLAHELSFWCSLLSSILSYLSTFSPNHVAF
ncbi:hypothetical protein B0H16DRAFT_1723599 [Mycena metata]|uniref:Peptidase M48 domain-containing protein n=1 Tax=Mycena metata TaxID=1033252 RepID=A0AAD7NAZ5_9AGAR|nr:hypothetical protein B0H16DRAFT_1723599 [Mycena metata]